MNSQPFRNQSQNNSRAPSKEKKNSPNKNKGLFTSKNEWDLNDFQNQPRYQLRHENKIYVNTIPGNSLPNVIPYIDSTYGRVYGNEVHSQYIPSSTQIQHIQQIQRGNLNQNKGQTYIINNESRNNSHLSHIHKLDDHVRYIQNQQPRKSPINKQQPYRSSSQNHNVHISYQNGQRFVPAPPQNFIVNRNITSLNSPTIPVVQSIKKTYIPHHIYNDIPVFTPEQYQVKTQQRQQNNQNDEGQQVLLACYQKVYQKYQEQKQANFTLKNQIAYLQDQLRKKPNNSPNTVIQKIVETRPQKKKKIRFDLLQQIVCQRYSTVLNDIINKRKNNCTGRLNQLFSQAQRTISSMCVIKFEEITTTSSERR